MIKALMAKDGNCKLVLCVLLLACMVLSGCVTTESPVNLGDGKVLGTITTEQALAILPLLAAASGNPAAVQLASAFALPTATTGPLKASSWVAVDESGELCVPDTLMSLYTKLSPSGQAQALTLFVAYQSGQSLTLTPYTALVQEMLGLIKTESESLGALAEWGLEVYRQQQKEFGYGAAARTRRIDAPDGVTVDAVFDLAKKAAEDVAPPQAYHCRKNADQSFCMDLQAVCRPSDGGAA